MKLLKSLQVYITIFLTFIGKKMATLFVQSRFAGLKIEDDEMPGENQKSKKAKANATKKIEPPKKSKTANNKSQAAPKKRKQKPAEPTKEQWEEWKQKDEEIVDGNFESELQEAILLSKLDYEEKKDVYNALKKEAESEKKVESTRKENKKNKKKNVMSLEQFNDMVNNEDLPIYVNSLVEEIPSQDEKKASGKDTHFFDRVQDETKNEILRDKILTRVRQPTITDEMVTRAQFMDALERKDQEIAALKEEIISLKNELLTVKSRNKKLCNILGQGEMKDKAEVLVEVEKLRAVQAELTGELATLHSDLEKERSKNADPRTKDKKKRGGNSEKEK
ncbi:G kinase-anchoring protein 1-like isoform X2 [Aricia agestis]|uniref:G kinase-anchoring protein 1-like isoform X2 n=1 Tax=Aricia agestis TaxID=91739 RepID=UPI001C2030EF|nr:G kinase-anchoring protein 1-like isoform X2 [Aricia agestis]